MRVRPANEDDIKFLVRKGLREVDVRECYRMSGRGPIVSLWDGYIYSDLCFVGEHDGEVFAVGGVAGKSLINKGGIVWLLGTDNLDSVWYSFAKESRRIIDVLLEEYGTLENMVDATNKKTIRWLKWLGFQCDPITLSPFGHPFRRFWREICVK